MKEIKDIAAKYAAGKTNEVMDNAIAQAYADGYRDGYRDREEEIPVDLRDNKTEFVDLGLPSGTLWSTDYESENGVYIYHPYCEAERLDIPTETQWSELLKYCRFRYSSKNANFECIGSNGKSITLSNAGYMITDRNDITRSFSFWLNSKTEKQMNMSASLVNGSKGVEGYYFPVFMGYKLPIRLVRSK